MTPEIQSIMDRLAALERKSLQAQLQPTEKENLKNNLFEGFHSTVPTDAVQTYIKIIWKNKPYYIKSGSSGVVYSGYVNSDGSAGNLPSGWTSAKTSTGSYTVTHNLGTANYAAPAIAYAAVAFPKFNAVNANDVQYVFLDAAGSLSDTTFYFTIILF